MAGIPLLYDFVSLGLVSRVWGGGYCWRGPQALPLPLFRDLFCPVEYCLCYAPARRPHDTLAAESTWLPLWPLPESGTSLDTTASEHLVASAYS